MSQEFSQFSPSEMITLYMDGELPDALQPSLFAMLSEQAELRQEMQDHFTVRRHMDTNLIAPPLELEESIMRRIGAVTVGASLNNPVSTGLATSATAWFGKVVQPLMFVLLGATLSGMYFAFNTDKSEQIVQMMKQENAPIQQIMQSPVINATNNAQILNMPSKRIASSMPVTKNMNIASMIEDDEQINNSNAEVKPTPEIAQQAVNTAPVDVIVPNNTQQIDIPKKELQAIINSEETSPFSLTLRGFTTHSFVDQKVTPNFNPFINNVSAGFQYDLSKEDAVFVELGQESVVQRFTGIENNYTIQYDQTYHAPWAMIGWQHRFHGGNSFKPLIRVGGGAMETGPMARMTIGVEYDLTRNITLIGGIEGMSTFYSYKGQWFSTQKAGITYGTRISLR
ncbi:MAG: hypothetical protein ACK5HH_06230 [Ignavibacteria bacterium]|jgi:hypothetical protein